MPSLRGAIVCSTLIASSLAFVHQPSLRLVRPESLRVAASRPVMMAKGGSSRRAARKAKKQQSLEPDAAPPQAVPVQAVPVAPAPAAPAAAAAPTAAPPVEPQPVAAPPVPQAEGPLSIGDPGLTSAFVQDKMGVTLPTMDEFRRREDAEAGQGGASRRASRRRERELNDDRVRQQAYAPPPPPVAPVAPVEKTAQEKLMELLAFDTIDDRVEKSDEAPYDMDARLLGRGLASTSGAYLLPYFQTGHMLLLVVLLLCSNVSYPGFPLTTLPEEYQDLIKQGIIITYLINAAAAVYSRGIAAAKQEPVNFWTIKVFLFGGLALGELTQAVPDLPKTKARR